MVNLKKKTIGIETVFAMVSGFGPRNNIKSLNDPAPPNGKLLGGGGERERGMTRYLQNQLFVYIFVNFSIFHVHD